MRDTMVHRGPIPDLLVIEWLTIITFLILLHELNPVNYLEKKLRLIKFKGIEIVIFTLVSDKYYHEIYSENLDYPPDKLGVSQGVIFHLPQGRGNLPMEI